MTDTRSTILSVAKSLFVKQGYTATSMRQVAEAVGIGKATIYHHFPDKQAIMMTLIEEIDSATREGLVEIEKEADPRRRFQIAATEALRFLFEMADLMQVARREVPGARERLVATFLSLYQDYIRLLRESLVTGMKMKIFRPLDPDDAAMVFITMVQGNFALVYLTGLRPDTPEKAAERLLDIYFNGINAA